MKFRCTLKSITVESRTVHVGYVIENLLGLAAGTQHFADGNYMLKFTLEGQPKQEKAHIQRGTDLLGGWL